MFSSPSKVLGEALKQSEERIAKGINPACRESSWNRGSEAVAHRGNENLFHITEGRGCSLHNDCSEIRQVSLSSNHPIFKASPRTTDIFWQQRRPGKGVTNGNDVL